jgi:hypothetical protein
MKLALRQVRRLARNGMFMEWTLLKDRADVVGAYPAMG